jgi:hypothetical protein
LEEAKIMHYNDHTTKTSNYITLPAIELHTPPSNDTFPCFSIGTWGPFVGEFSSFCDSFRENLGIFKKNLPLV